MIRIAAAVVLCTFAASLGAVSVVGSVAPYALVYDDAADLGTTIDLPGLAEVTASFGIDRASFQALQPQVIPMDGGPAWDGGVSSKPLGSLTVNYDAAGTVTFTFPVPGRFSPTFSTGLGYNYGGASSAGRSAFSGARTCDHISTIPSLADAGAAYSYNCLDAAITTTGGRGVAVIGFCVSTRSSITCRACDVTFTLSDGSIGTVALPDFSGSTSYQKFFIGYQAPSGLTISRVQIPDIETASGSKDNMTLGIDDLSFVMSPAAAIPGDIDGDGHVNIFDIFVIAECWNTQTGDPLFNPACDLDADGAITIFDIFVIAENWNR